MATAMVLESAQTVADLLERLGDVPPERVLLDPPPGTATEADVLRLEAQPRKRRCELIDGTLVEKATMGFAEGRLTLLLGKLLLDYVVARNLGVVTPPDLMLRVLPGQVRLPDIGYFSWGRFPDGRCPADRIPAVAPDLAVEVLSPSNTAGEMERKRQDYFAGGTHVIWQVDAGTRTVDVYLSPETATRLAVGDVLRGEPALPGFALPLADLFGELDRQADSAV